jgi:myosin-5
MAENIYSKGTRVWFEDKDQAWISAEVASASKSADDSIKLVFIDERGKVLYIHFYSFLPILIYEILGNHD